MISVVSVYGYILWFWKTLTIIIKVQGRVC